MRCERCDDPRTCGECDDVCDPDACCGDPWGCERERCPSDWVPAGEVLAVGADGTVYVVDVGD